MIPWAEDGAHEGVQAHMAFQAILHGTEELSVPVVRVPADAMGRLLALDSTPHDGWPEHDGSDAAYDRCAWGCARSVLGAYRSDPRLGMLEGATLLWDLLEVRPETAWLAEGDSTPSAFQWGWGVNCARRLCELAPLPNPALVVGEIDPDAIPGRGCRALLVPGGITLNYAMVDA